jgi:hypothetical protein
MQQITNSITALLQIFTKTEAKNLPLISSNYKWSQFSHVRYRRIPQLSHQPFTAEDWIQYPVSPYGTSSGQHGSGTGYFFKYFCFPLPVPFHNDPHSFLHLPPMPHNHTIWWCHYIRLKTCLWFSSNTSEAYQCCPVTRHYGNNSTSARYCTCRQSGLMVILRGSCGCCRIDLRHVIGALTGRQSIGGRGGARGILTGIWYLALATQIIEKTDGRRLRAAP